MSARRKNAKVSAFQGERPKDIIAANNVKANGTESKPQSKGDRGVGIFQVVPALFDFYAAVSMVFGGCCSNMIAYEQLLLINPHIGSALTFSQILFITLQSLPSFLVFPKSGLLPELKPRQVPLKQWAIQVMVLTGGSLLNNWAYAYNVPLTIFIVFRSASLPVSMILGYLVLKKRYSILQLFSISIVTVGVILVTLSKTAPSSDSSSANISAENLGQYSVGISMLVVSLLCTGVLGVLQEKTYTKYGPCWKEGVFYTHVLSLPFFVFLGRDIKQGITSLADPRSGSKSVYSFAILLGNLMSQLICVSGVNQLTSQVSSVSTNIVLTARKALSLCISVWWFGNEWNYQLGVGAFMVFFGSILYSINVDRMKKKD